MGRKDFGEIGRRSKSCKLAGRWKVVELPDFEDDYIKESKNPHFDIRIKGRTIRGEYHFGLQDGTIGGELIVDERVGMRFSFEGHDEMNSVFGYGEAYLIDDNTLDGKMNYHLGETFRFVCKRRK